MTIPESSASSTASMNEESLLDCEVRWLLHCAGYSMCHVRSGLLLRRLLDARQPVAHDHAAPPFRGRLRCRAAWTFRRRRQRARRQRGRGGGQPALGRGPPAIRRHRHAGRTSCVVQSSTCIPMTKKCLAVTFTSYICKTLVRIT